jgi:hypothetical protein
MERKMLSLTRDSEVLKLNQMYELFLSDPKFLDHYLVYSHLKNLGFVIKRHSDENFEIKIKKQETKKCRGWYEKVEYFQEKKKKNVPTLNSVSLNPPTFIKQPIEMNDRLFDQEEELKIIFNVFKKGSTRNQKELPIFSIVIQHCSNKFPSIHSIKNLKRKYNEIYFAILDGTSIQLYSF